MSQSDFVSRGQTLVAQGQYQEAVKVCRLGLLGKPAAVEGRVVLGQALLALGRHDEVLGEMRVALELDPNAVGAQALKGEALLRKGDAFAAVETLQRAAMLAPTDRKIAGLLRDAEAANHGRADDGQGAIDYIGPGDSHTKHYPDHVVDDDDVDSTGGHTRQLAPAPARGGDATPAPSLLAVGDRSMTVEVDPEMDGIEMSDDFGDVAAPPTAGPDFTVEAARQAIKAARQAAARAKPQKEVTLILDDDELMDASETPMPEPVAPSRRGMVGQGASAPTGSRSMVRNAVDRDSGPLDEPTIARAPLVMPVIPPAVAAPVIAQAGPSSRQIQAASRPTMAQDSVSPSQLASMLAQQPHIMQVTPLLPSAPRVPLNAPAPAIDPRSAIAAALPTAAAIPMPGVIGVAPSAAAANKTMALNVAQQQSADALDAVLGPAEPRAVHALPWQRNAASPIAPTRRAMDPGLGIAAADEPTRVPVGVDARIAAAVRADTSAHRDPTSEVRPLKTGVRTRAARSRMQIAVWVAIGALVIGGGVFAGFQIRSVRLRKQIAAARTRATDTAKADTLQGWLAARDSLADIVRAADTPDNRAALARANALLAYEFGDADARALAEAPAEPAHDTLDSAIAAAYLALARDDNKAARTAADHAVSLAPADGAALYVDGQAELAAGDFKAAVSSFKTATEKDPRALYFLGLAHAQAAALVWDEAIAATTRALASSPDHPGAVIASATLQLESGRLSPRSSATSEARAQILHVIDEGAHKLADQPHGVSAMELARANLALARLQFALNEPSLAREAVQTALKLGVDDQRLAEETCDTLLAIGDLAHARDAANRALHAWPESRRARIALAEASLAEGNATDALDVLAKLGPSGEGMSPRAQAVRGEARAAVGDVDLARGDFDAVLQKLPGLEPALIGRAWIDLSAGDVEGARKRIEPHYDAATADLQLTTVYAAILRATNDPANRDRAGKLLQAVVNGPPTVASARAQLELARVYRDSGAFGDARAAYAKATEAGNTDATRDAAEIEIQDRDPSGGRDILDSLLKKAGDHPPTSLLVEAARAHTLTGDPSGADTLLTAYEKAPGALHWQLDRERGRLQLRSEDLAGAAKFLARALDDSGSDIETMLLAADAATGDDKQGELVARLQKLIPERLGTRAEAQIITGKLALAAGKDAEAEAAYTKAHDQLDKEHASPRRIAQANFGLAVIAYNRKDDDAARARFKDVMDEDPSIYAAYLYAADMAAAKQPKGALELLEKAVTFDPANASAWLILGRQAQAVGNAKLLADAIERLTALTPSSEGLKELSKLKIRSR